MYSIKDMMAAGRTTARAVRWWEQQGLLGTVERTEGGHRVYTSKQLEKAKNIALAKMLGMSLGTLRDMGDFTFADLEASRMSAIERLKTFGEYDL